MLIERDAELAVLRRAVAGAADGHGAAVLIRGPLGVGRSALLEEITDVALGAGLQVLSADVLPSDREHAFGVANRLFGTGGVPAYGLPQVDGPLVLLIDDLQWTDDATLSWLGSCVREAHRCPVALIGTLRDGDEAADRPALRELAAMTQPVLRLGALSEAGAAAVLRATLGDRATAELVSACHRATAGIPLLLTELAHDLAGRDDPARPDRVAAGFATRAWRLRERLATGLRATPLAWECAMAIVVLADRAEPALVQRLTGGDPLSVAAACTALHRLGVLAPGADLRFTTELLRDLAAELMTTVDYERLQCDAALASHEAGLSAEEVVERLVEVPSAGPDWAAEEIHVAAEEAIRHGEPRRAARYLRSALAAAGEDDRPRLLADLATAEARFDVAAALRHLGQAVAELPSARERAVAVSTLPVTSFCTAGRSPAAALVERVAGDLGELDGRLGPRLAARYAFTRCEDPAVVAGAAGRIDALGARPSLSTVAERELLAVLLYTVTVSATADAATVAALSERLLSREPASSRDAYDTATLAVTSSLAAGAPQQALRWLDSALELAEHDRPTAVEKAMLLCQRAVMLGYLGRLELARTAAWEARRLAGDCLRQVAEIPVVALAAVAMIVGDRALAAEVLECCPEPDSHPTTGLHLRAALLMVRGTLVADRDPSAAMDDFLDCGVALRCAGWENPALFPWRTCAARVQRGLGNIDSALALLDEECVLARRWGAPEPIGRALRVRASLCPPAEAVRLLGEAEAMLRAADNRLGLAKTLLDHGLALRATGRAGADDRVREAYLLATSHGAGWLADRALAAGWSGAGPESVTRLTGTERKVAELVLSGRTNADIAAELQVTRRAVEKHLTNCYRKLGVTGRAELCSAFDRNAASDMYSVAR